MLPGMKTGMKVQKFCIPFEGYLTYGGMNGRDMAALAVGLEENTEFDNIETRIKQVQYLAARLDEYGIPYQRPVGGHALFVDADKVLSSVRKKSSLRKLSLSSCIWRPVSVVVKSVISSQTVTL